MQKARIVSTSLDDANLLAEQLRAEGFSVEVTKPGVAELPSVDLEILLEYCSQEAALDRAAEIAHRTHADIYVAPGIFDNVRPKNANDAPLLLPSVVDTINGIAAGLQNKRDLMAKALREQRALARQNRHAHNAQKESCTPAWNLPDTEIEPAWREEMQPKAEEERSIRLDDAAAKSAQERAESVAEISDGQRMRIPWSRTRELRAAFAIAAVCAVAMMWLWTTVMRMPRSPLSGAVQRNVSGVEQQVPFGAATSKLSQTSSVQQPDRSSQSFVGSPGQVPSAVNRDVKKPGAALVSQTTLAKERDEIIAEDQVVYIGSRPMRSHQTRPAAPQHASLRRYSDIQ